MQIAGYTVQETLHQGKRFLVYRAMAEDDKTPCILKMLQQPYQGTTPGTKAIEHEYQLLSQIDSEYVIKVSKHLRHNKSTLIVLEDNHGKSLKTFLEHNPPFSIAQFLDLAVLITNGLAAIHRHNIIHKDINPSNIIWNSQTGSLKIIDFDIASKFDVKVSYLGNPEKLQGTLPYISPEQTGRMNRRVDQRSDLYSLGVTFYEMLTGKRPFEFRNPMEMVHAHLAREPEPPYLLNEQIPMIVSEIVLKLLAKNPEDRYQSAEGLKYDLEQVQKATLTGFGTLSGFTPGTRDFSGKLHIPEKLYGREQEIEQLLSAYQRVSQGAKEMLLVAGYSGTGKTALVSAIHPPITKDRGMFISGKFEQLQRNVPYFAFVQAFNQLCDVLLTERQEVLAQWKEDLLQATGTLGKVLTDIIPNLERIIGKQPDVPDVGGEEAKNRLHYVLLRFLQAICTKDHPLVMFLDDVQWADNASLDLLQVLMEDRQNHYFFFIGAYRDNEVSAAHPLMTTLEEIQKHEIPLHTIPVHNLSRHHVQEWVGETLNMDGEPGHQAVAALVNLIYQKTQGNAFFTLHFLENLYEEDLLSFDFKQSRWTWDITEIEKQHITDNVVELLVRKIQTLPAEAQDTLKLAACFGNVFDLPTLSVISEIGQEDHQSTLEIALSEHLISPGEDEEYRFVHDRIRQAAYALIAEEEKPPVHLKIGRLLVKTFAVSQTADVSHEAEQRIFDIVRHFNLALDLITGEAENIQIAWLNLKAARKARTAIAYQPGWEYVQKALLLLPEAGWHTHYELTRAVYHEAIQLAYLSGRHSEIDRLGDIVLKFAATVWDKSTVYEYQIMGLIAQNELAKAVDITLELLDSLGVTIPREPDEQEIADLFAETQSLLNKIDIHAVTTLPVMKDEEKQVAMRLYLLAAVAIVFTVPELYPVIINKLLGLSLKDGVSPETPYVLTEYSLLNVLEGNTQEGYRLGEIALELLNSLSGYELMKSRVLTLLYVYIFPWKQHYKDISAKYLEIYQRVINVGDLEYAAYTLMYHCMLQRSVGIELSVAERKGYTLQNTISQSWNQPVAKMVMGIFLKLISHLGKDTVDQISWDEDTGSSLSEMTEYVTAVIRFMQGFSQLVLDFLFEKYHLYDYTNDLTNAPLLTGTIEYPDLLFFSALTRLHLCGTATRTEKATHLKEVRHSLKTMKQWAAFGPMNFQHRYYVMQAELYRVTGKAQQAAEYYDNAIQSAREHEFLHVEAIAHELAAKFYRHQNREELAEFYFQKALLCYRKWGATAKVKHLEEHYPKYVHPSTGREETTSTGTTSEQLDVKSILKASHTLSGEVQLTRLLEKMMEILIENAGAQRGVFIEQRGEQLLIQAEGTADGVTGILRAVPVAASETLPLAVINYVARSKQQLVFENVSKESTYSTDPYIRHHQPKSVVCVPVLKQAELFGIIYLENNLVEGAFTPARLEVLDLLSAQIAISVENAELYENLEDKVRQRTLALQQAHDSLEKTHQALERSHKDITDSVNYASRIQRAVLPAREVLTELLPEHFILYKPCAVVSGDFYWIRELDNTIVVAAVDCTGHGVPGALVSMLGMAFLNEIVPLLAAQSQLQADTILNELRHNVKTALKQTGKLRAQREGMDMALCILDPMNHQLQYAGAYNPLYLIREQHLIEIKADRMPIGIHRKERPFRSHDLACQRGDMLYLFTDGFIDQAGKDGIGGFSKKRFQQLLLDIHHEPVSTQQEILQRRFEAWKGHLPQTDDILILGIRV